MKSIRLALAILATSNLLLNAEEGGSGHYFPGSMSSFMDGVPAEETFLARLNIASYQGTFSASEPLPIAGLRGFEVDASSFAAGLTVLWSPKVDWGNWSYAMSATVPFVWMDVSADVEATLPRGLPVRARRSDSDSGIGDIVLMPFMFNYKASDDFNVNFRVAAYAPTGSYEVGRLANTGKNFWTFEPTVGLVYFGKKNGIEASLFTGIDFNTENTDTHYKSGAQFHIDGTLAQHFPIAGGLAGLGVTGFWYQQVTGDSGSGANLGSFEGRTSGIGPVLSYMTKVGRHDVIGELKWTRELETQRRLEGDYIWFKLICKF